MMWRFKECPRCSGDLFFEEHLGIKYWICLQCGFEYTPNFNERILSIKQIKELILLPEK